MTYSLPIYYPITAALIGLVASIVALHFIRNGKPVKSIAIALFIAVIFLGGLAPMGFLDRITISNSIIEQKVGYWFAPTITRFRFADISAVHIGAVKDAKYRDRKAWLIYFKDGHMQKYRPSTLWDLNEADIVKHFQSANISFQ